MTETIIALNGSARKNGNSAGMLEAFVEGVKSVDEDIRVETVHLFDLDYKGCRGCHGCELKGRNGIGCIQQDGASALLKRMREADGIVFATPVFFWELSAQLRALLERYIYPGALDHHQEAAAIFTMYQPEHVSRRMFTPHADAVRAEFCGFLRNVGYTELIINNTQSWETGTADRYINITPETAAYSEAHHAEQWPLDLQRGKEAGAAFARRLKQH